MDTTLQTTTRTTTDEAERDRQLARSGDERAAGRVLGRDLLAAVVARLDWSDPATLSRAFMDYVWCHEQALAVLPEVCPEATLTLPVRDGLTLAALRLVRRGLEAEAEARWAGGTWVGADLVRFSAAGPCIGLGRVERQTAKQVVTDDTPRGKRVKLAPSAFHMRGSCPRCSGGADYPMGYMD